MKYENIVNLPHRQSSTRPRMPISDRAAQFAPFAALTGHDAAIRETARQVGKRIELSEDAKAQLDVKLAEIAQRIENLPEIAVTYFKPDEKKEGGEYITLCSRIKKIDVYERTIIMENGTEIFIDDVVQIFSDIF